MEVLQHYDFPWILRRSSWKHALLHDGNGWKNIVHQHHHGWSLHVPSFDMLLLIKRMIASFLLINALTWPRAKPRTLQHFPFYTEAIGSTKTSRLLSASWLPYTSHGAGSFCRLVFCSTVHGSHPCTRLLYREDTTWATRRSIISLLRLLKTLTTLALPSQRSYSLWKTFNHRWNNYTWTLTSSVKSSYHGAGLSQEPYIWLWHRAKPRTLPTVQCYIRPIKVQFWTNLPLVDRPSSPCIVAIAGTIPKG